MNHMTDSIDTAPPGPTSHLCIFMGMQKTVIVSVEFSYPRKNGGFNGAIKPNREGFGRKQEFDVFFRNKQFYNLAQNRNHTAMVDSDPFLKQHHQFIVFG